MGILMIFARILFLAYSFCASLLLIIGLITESRGLRIAGVIREIRKANKQIKPCHKPTKNPATFPSESGLSVIGFGPAVHATIASKITIEKATNSFLRI